jgi:lipoprotein signal peptidase
VKIHRYLWLSLILPLVVDQSTKWWMRTHGTTQLNQAGIWGQGDQLNWIVIMLVTLSLVGWKLLHSVESSFIERVGWLIILSSGLSNLIDRLLWGGVWDWIVYPVLNVVGNIADVLLGVGLLFVIFATRHKNSQK